MTPLNITSIYFPKKIGSYSGIILGGYGLGSLIFSNVMYLLINPNNEPIDVNTGYFPIEVASNLPFAIKISALIYLIVLLIGSLMLFISS